MSASVLSRRQAVIGAGAALWPSLVAAQALSTPPPDAPVETPPAPPLTLEELVRLELGEDDAHRMRVPVSVNGRGPFPFTVDTGADHTVLSAELATALGLDPIGSAQVNGIAGVRTAPCVRVDRVEAGAVKLERARLPLLPRAGLGGLGLIGLDCLTGQRMEIDFDRRTMELRRSRGFAREPDEVVVRGKSRFGKLILVDSSARSQPVYVVLDSGAENTLGNAALRDLLESRRRTAKAAGVGGEVVLQSATGQIVEGRSDVAPELILGGVRMRRVPIIYADLHTFHLYGLEREPALMLGMDVLRSFRRVWVDFGRREVGFLLPRDVMSVPAFSFRT